MSQVNLLPQEILERQKTRRTTGLVAVVGLLAILGVVAFYLLQNSKLGTVNDQIAAQNATNEQIQAQITALQPAAELQTQAQQQQALLNSAWAGEVSFSGLLMDVSRVIPPDMALSSLQFTLTPPPTSATTTTPTTGTTLIGSMTTAGEAVSTETVATWLMRLDGVRGWANPWTSSTTLTSDTGPYNESTTVDLTSELVTARGRQGTSGAG